MKSIFASIFTNQWLFVAFIAFVLLALAEVGYRVGLRLHVTNDEARRSQIGGVQGAVLGLLALLLGFTFSMAVTRFETRRDLVLKEANGIGTTWLRADLLPEADREPVRKLLASFVEARLKYQALAEDPAMLAEGLRQSAEIENALWEHAKSAAKEAPTPITATFISALNDMIDTDAERVNAHRNPIPGAVWFLLVLVAGAGCFISGYGAGAQGVRSMFPDVFLPGLIAVVIMLIFDFTHSHQGLIGISQQPMLDLKASMAPTTGAH